MKPSEYDCKSEKDKLEEVKTWKNIKKFDYKVDYPKLVKVSYQYDQIWYLFNFV
mgnify:CR=1 FL=1